MGHKNQYLSRKRKFTGNQYKSKRSSIGFQANNDTTVAILCCPVCLHDELTLTEDSRYGICSNLSLKCRNCDYFKAFTSSEKINNKFKLNTLAFALRVIGKGYTAGNKLFGMLDLPFLSKTAFRNQELKIQQAASIVSIESMKNAATEVKKIKKFTLRIKKLLWRVNGWDLAEAWLLVSQWLRQLHIH
ncbi:uncharacterized protein TNCV_3515581 [Trichonephila clavipes]|nr:uncharacterized protein TNCV_3515581 [Trichonephila clavipes]